MTEYSKPPLIGNEIPKTNLPLREDVVTVLEPFANSGDPSSTPICVAVAKGLIKSAQILPSFGENSSSHRKER